MRNFFALLLAIAMSPAAHAMIKPENVRHSEARKTGLYLDDGMFVGGDRAVDNVTVKDIRRAENKGFERWVIDLQSNVKGEPAAISRPPYYQVAASGAEDRVVITLWGKPKLDFDPPRILARLRKSPWVSHVDLLPRVEDDSWTFVIGTKNRTSVEVFELSSPVRLILDLRHS